MTQQAPLPKAPARWRARALVYAAWLAAEHDECGEADRLAEEALELFRSLGDHRGIGSSLNTLGYSSAMRGDDEAAIGFYEESYTAFSAADHDWRLYPAVNLATVLLASRSDVDRSRHLLEEALEYFDANEFEDEAAFREWYDSPGYQEALPLRMAATDSRACLARGLR